MNEAFVTLTGWVGNDIEWRDANGAGVACFRLGCTPRYFKDNAWVDGETSWFTVNAWRALGEHVRSSIHKGDPVVVHGRVRVDVWEREDNTKSQTLYVDASFVGHDLNKGVSSFTRAARPGPSASLDDEGVREMVHSQDAGGPQLTSTSGIERQQRSEPAA